MYEFTFFYGGVFSQWYFVDFTVDGVRFNCAEQYMMYEKALFFKDNAIAAKIMLTNHPRDQKALGRLVKNFDKSKWDEVARSIVYKGNWHKFKQNPVILEALNNTGESLLIEASPSDKIWGIGLGMNDPLRLNRDNWQGTNWLGEVLTKVRDDLKVGVFDGDWRG